MEHLRIKTMAQSTHNVVDLTEVCKVVAYCITFIVGLFKGVDSYFAHKKRTKQEFIVGVVKATMDSCLSDFKQDFHEFKVETKSQIADFNKTVIKIYAEVKK